LQAGRISARKAASHRHHQLQLHQRPVPLPRARGRHPRADLIAMTDWFAAAQTIDPTSAMASHRVWMFPAAPIPSCRRR
jgi:hypothetical protein